MQIQFPITLLDAYLISPHVRHFNFQIPGIPAFNFQAGQFITLHFEKDGQTFKRSYSIANAPQQNNRLEFAAGFVEGGVGSALLFGLNPGDEVMASGPYGRLVLSEDPVTRYILMATSTGITPYRSMLATLSQRLADNPALHVVILQGVQKRDHLLYTSEFNAFAARFPQQVQIYYYLSREPQVLATAGEYSGYIQQALSDLQLNPVEDKIYLCGNPTMIDDTFERLKNLGFSTRDIVREKYLSR